jgi:hypothetical protein
MTDVLCLSLVSLWFALTAAFIKLCDWLMPPDRESKP